MSGAWHGTIGESPLSKSHVSELSRVYACIFQDAAYAYPALRGEFEKDLAHLSRCVEQRGLHTFCVDLPALGKHLDKCLASGKYMLSGLPLSKRLSRGVAIPKFLGGLYLLVFDTSGDLKEDYDVQALFFLRQILYLAKKTAVACSQKRVEKEISDFLLTDSQLPPPETFWEMEGPTTKDVQDTYAGFSTSDLYTLRVGQVSDPFMRSDLSALLVNLDFVSKLISTTLGEYLYSEWSFRHGPGAISEVAGPTNKYSWRNWSPRLEFVFPIADCGFHNYASWADSADQSRISSKEPYSRLISVLKTYTRPRLIAAEPSEHQWCQQNIWHYFRSRTERTWLGDFVHFRDQTHNQELCREGSQSGKLATVDLSSASDHVTCHAVGQFFRVNPTLLKALQATRTRLIQVKQSEKSDYTVLELRKFSTMGSACTFPVETLIFLGISLASIITKRRLKPTLKNLRALAGEVAVFGDDIVIPEDSRELLFGALKILDFKVNTDKSFWTGRFRESCGVDSFAGVEITPAYWKAPNDGGPDSYTRTVETANNFYKKFLVNVSAYLDSTIERRFTAPLVWYESGFCGRKSFVTPSSPGSFKSRWNKGLQRTEYLVPLPLVKVKRTPITDDSALLQFFTEDPLPTIHWEAGFSQRPTTKLRCRWVSTFDLVAQQDR